MEVSSKFDRSRYYFFGTIRSLCLFFVFFFHCTRIFDANDWHVKNNVRTSIDSSFFFEVGMIVMPIFFFVSGASIWFSIQKRSVGIFIKNLFKRFFFPLAFGLTVLALPQVYIERVFHGEFHGSLISFIPYYFHGFYGFGGNFAWMGLHLWYLLMLFLFSLVLVPYFISGKYIFRRPFFEKIFSNPLIFLLFAIIVCIPGWKLHPGGWLGIRVWGGWNFAEHIVFFAAGFAIFSSDRFVDNNRKYKWVSLVIMAALTPLVVYWSFQTQKPVFRSTEFDIHLIVKSIACWAGISAMLGFAYQYGNTKNRILNYANRAALPFYILNQPVIIALGYYIVKLHISAYTKFFLVTVVSFCVTIFLYELIKRNGYARWLFGIPAKGSVKRINNLLSGTGRLIFKLKFSSLHHQNESNKKR